jgi:hypothetical protein
MDKLFYNFQPLPRDVIERTSDDASKHIVAQLFNKSMPQFQTGISEMLGGFAKTFEETDPDIMDELNGLTLSPEDVVDIFDNFIGRVSEYERGKSISGINVGLAEEKNELRSEEPGRGSSDSVQGDIEEEIS